MIVSALDGSRGDFLYVGLPLLKRVRQGDVNLVVAIGPMEEVERLGLVVKAQGCAFVAVPAERLVHRVGCLDCKEHTTSQHSKKVSGRWKELGGSEPKKATRIPG